jgi:hypothetical protein
MKRLKNTGAALDHGTRLSFTFDGKRYWGTKGDTLASALLANGVRVMGRSFKYHRPRGVWGAWVDEPNAILSVTLNGRELPNCLATTTYLEHGMEARAVNAWPSANRDIKGVLDWGNRFLGAGFYYKTFIWPDWHLFEPSIRKMAGLGAVTLDHLDDYVSDQTHDHCDTLVVGGGPAGRRPTADRRQRLSTGQNRQPASHHLGPNPKNRHPHRRRSHPHPNHRLWRLRPQPCGHGRTRPLRHRPASVADANRPHHPRHRRHRPAHHLYQQR